MLSEYSVSNHTLLIKFDANQQYSKEVEVSAYNANESISTNPFNDLPESKTLCLNRLPPWTDPDSVKNLMVRLSNGSVVKVSIRFELSFEQSHQLSQSKSRKIWFQSDNISISACKNL